MHDTTGQSTDVATFDLRVCVARTTKDRYTETFVDDHVKAMGPNVMTIWHSTEPDMTGDGRRLLSLPRRIVQAVAARMGVPRRHFLTGPLARHLQKERVQVVLAEYGLTAVGVFAACRKAGVPLVAHFHGFDASDWAFTSGWAKRYQPMFESAAAIIGVSRAMIDRLEQMGAPRDKLNYNPCGVDTSRFTGASPATNPPTLIAVGRMVNKKSPLDTLRAFEQVARQEDDARLVMMGDGPLLEQVQKMVQASGVLRTHVDLRGRQPHDAVAQAMRESRALVQHSRVDPVTGDREGTPVSVMEASACGLPVVATRHEGIADVVVHGETGLLVEEGDVDGMAEHMLTVVREPDLAARLGAAGRVRVMAEFSTEQTVARLRQIVRDAAATG